MVETERLPSRKRIINIPNAEQLVDKFIAGDQDAFEVLDGHLRPRLRGYFFGRLPDDADDLTQETLIVIVSNLPRFKEKNSGEEDFSEHLVSSSFVIAKQVLNKEFRRRHSQHIYEVGSYVDEDSDIIEDESINWLAQKNGHFLPSAEDEVIMQEQESEQESERQQLMLELRGKIAEILPRSQRKVIDLMLDGKTRIEIADELKYSQSTTKSYAWRAKLMIERKLLSPAGWLRVGEFSSRISQAVSEKRIPAYRFLGTLYITEADVQRYEDTKRITDNDLLKDGYLLLSEVTATKENRQIRERNQGLLRLHRGCYYISREHLEQFRQNQPKQDQDPRIPKDSQYKVIFQLSETQKEYKQLLFAAKKGRLRSVKQGRNWLTTQEEADKFREATMKETVIFEAKTLRTDQNGEVEIVSDGKTLDIKRPLSKN